MKGLDKIIKMAVLSWRKRCPKVRGKQMTINQCVAYARNMIENYGYVLALGKNGLSASVEDFWSESAKNISEVTCESVTKEYFGDMQNALLVYKNGKLYELQFSSKIAKKFGIIN